MYEISDDELYVLSLEENEDAKNLLFERFRFIIDINLKKYKRIAIGYGIDMKDFESEALYGFSDAISSYRHGKEAGLATFINLCVSRRLKKCLVKASRAKNLMEKEAFSLEYVYDEYGSPLLDLISDHYKNDPLQHITKREDYEELVALINSKLSKLEQDVFKYMLDGYSYRQIAIFLKKDVKVIDNAMQRIKVKIKKILQL